MHSQKYASSKQPDYCITRISKFQEQFIIFSLEILGVNAHVKRGQHVSTHLHLNATFLLEADPAQPLRVKPDENSAVGWIAVEDIPKKSTEHWFVKRIYSKLCEKAKNR